MRQFIDLSVCLENDADWAPWWARNRVKHQGHKFGAFVIWLLHGLRPNYLRNRLGWANDILNISTHGTTHLDAPWHYAPESDGGPAKTIDEVPLEWCFADGVVLDLRHKDDGEGIETEDLKTALAGIGYSIKPMDIVLIQTGNDRLLGSEEYFTYGTGMTAEATRWILEQGVKVTGIDSWGWDLPLPKLAKQARREKNSQVFWAAHYVGAEVEYCHLERLTNLDKLPRHGFKVCCFPLKVKGGSAGPVRVVAMVEASAVPDI